MQVYIGQTFDVSVEFIDDNGDALIGVTPPTYRVLTQNKQLVTSGSGSQDTLNPGLWKAALTIPEGAPLALGYDKYSLWWTFTSTDGIKHKSLEYFNVDTNVEFAGIEVEQDRVIVQGSSLVDFIKYDANSVIDNIKMTILKEDGSEVYSETLVSGGYSETVVGGERIISSDFEETSSLLLVDDTGISPYVARWNYSADGIPQEEFHFVYVVNIKLLGLMNQLRKTIDKARNEHPNPALRYTNSDLATYLMQGLAYINAMKPSITSWTATTLPTSLSLGLVYAGAYCALSAQYLAEGQAAFDFSGQAVSLNIDRTPYIDTALGRIMDYLNDKLPDTKKLIVRSGSGMGVLGVNIGNSLGISAYGLRMDRLRRSLNGFG